MNRRYTSKYRKEKIKIIKIVILSILILLIWVLNIAGKNNTDAIERKESIEEFKSNVEKFVGKNNELKKEITNKENVIFQVEPSNVPKSGDIFETDLKRLSKFEYLKNNYYIVDEKTKVSVDKLDVEKFLLEDLKIKDNIGYKVLIFHTHSSELYEDSKNTEEGIVGVGKELKMILENKYGMDTLHITDSYDQVDGQTQILGSYSRMNDPIKKILEENPSIEIVLDLHRDGVPDDVRMVKEVNGKPMAKIMFVNGLSEVLIGGEVKKLEELPNPYLEKNLAFSFNMVYRGNLKYNGLFRKVYLHAYRYSLHLAPKTLLVEVGAQTNTFEEAKNSMEVLAEILNDVVR